MKDTIVIKGLVVPVYIGVPDEERAAQQVLRLHIELVPENGFTGLDDSIERTVNYYEVAQQVKTLAALRPRRLIETLADELAAMILEKFAVTEVQLEVEKFIMADTDFVGLRMTRTR